MRSETPRWRRYLRLFGPDPAADIDDELRHHIEALAEHYRARGLSADDARRRAERRFGNIGAVRSECTTIAQRRRRAVARAEMIDRLVQDVRFALRTFARTPAFTCAALLTLALGIGANTAVFSVVNAALLRPLPWRSPEKVLAVWTRFVPESGSNYEYFGLSAPEFRDYRTATRALSDVAAFRTGRVNVAGGGEAPDRIPMASVSASFFRVVGVQPTLGRAFQDGEDARGAPCVAVLSDALWRTRYAGSATVLNQTMQLDGSPCTIVGVMPPGFFFPDPQTKLWRPFSPTASPRLGEDRESHWFIAVARLAGGATLADANAELKPLMASWRRENKHHVGHFIVLQPFRDVLVGNDRRLLLVILGSAGLVLLIICANLANLLLARGEARRREVAVRVALGAGRARLIRQLLTESLLLAGTGGLLALLVGPALVRVLTLVDPDSLPAVGPVSMDARVYAFTIALSLVTGVLFGLVPAFQVTALQLHDTLKNRALTSTGRSLAVRRALVVLEVSLSLAVVVAAGLLVRSYQSLQGAKVGFERTHVLALDVTLPGQDYAELARISEFYEGVQTQAKVLPGVERAGFISELPLRSNPPMDGFRIEGRAEPGAGEPDIEGGYIMVTPGALEALGVPLVRGRMFDTRDVAGAPLVALIDETAAKKFWPGQNPVGQRIRYYDSDDAPWLTIVGVVGPVHFNSVRQDPRPSVYVSLAQRPRAFYEGRDLTMVVRSSLDDGALSSAIRRIVKQADPIVPVTRVQGMDEVVRGANLQPRFAAALMSLFGLVALLVGALGVYGVLSYLVQTRTNEIGIRMALGADARRVLRQVLQQGLALAGVGIVVGSAAALLATRLLSSLLFEVSRTDVWTYAVVIAVLTGTSVLASWLPARRATKVDPLTALRSG